MFNFISQDLSADKFVNPTDERRFCVAEQPKAERIESQKAIARQLKKYQAQTNFEAIKARGLAKQAKRKQSREVAA